MKKIIPFIILIAFLFGCSSQKIDSSTDKNFVKSLEKVKASLTKQKNKEFAEALQTIAFSKVDNIFEMANPEALQIKIKNEFNGKTADEIIAEGNRISAEQKKKEKEQMLNEIEELKKEIAKLEDKKSKAEQDKENLKKFKVVRSRFYYKESSFISEPVIELSVKNETQYPISRVYFEGILSTPGRSVPWVKDTFNYPISGGLEPGEETTWNLAPNMFSEWGKAPKDRNDMVLTVTTTRIDGVDGKPIYNAEFSESNQTKLKDSIERLKELNKNIIK